MLRTPFVLAALALLAVACGGVASPSVPNECGKLTSCVLADGGTADSGSADAAFPDAPVDPPGVGFDVCTGPGTCALAFKSCCGTCGLPGLKDYDAVRRDALNDHRQSMCGEKPQACPGCASQFDPFVAGSLQSVCNAGACQGIDFRADAVSKCTTDKECVVRGSDCCECGSTNYVALNKNSVRDFEKQVCEPNVACAECAPAFPARAFCNQTTKHCDVERLDGG